MFRRSARWLKRALALLLLVACVLLAVSNREEVTVSLFPLPYEATLRLFILIILCFAGGALAGWLTASRKLLKQMRLLSELRARNDALENEREAAALTPPAA